MVGAEVGAGVGEDSVVVVVVVVVVVEVVPPSDIQ